MSFFLKGLRFRIMNERITCNDKDNSGFSLSYYLEKVSNLEQVNLFKRGIDKVVKEDTTVCDLDCGTGIFTYLQQESKKVYAVEFDKNVINIAMDNIII
jgi:predicted RNA methylase